MRQVLTNLLTNAHLYTPEGGRLEVRLRNGAEGIALSVSDTGRGMSPEELEHVFDRFSRGSASHSATPGTGLGLAIVRSLVELHRGASTSTPPPARARPSRSPCRARPVPGVSDAAREALRGRRVLVLDDEPDIAALIAQRLEPYGVRAEVVHRGDEALDRLRTEHFDAVTVDILMPGMSGFEVLRVLRADPRPARACRSVVVSVFSGREALSGEWVVSKPIDAEELADALGAAVLAGRVRVLVVQPRRGPRAALLDARRARDRARVGQQPRRGGGPLRRQPLRGRDRRRGPAGRRGDDRRRWSCAAGGCAARWSCSTPATAARASRCSTPSRSRSPTRARRSWGC